MDLKRKIGNYLVANELVEQEGVDLFVDHLPQSPDHLVAIFENRGLGPLLESGATRSIQLVVRGPMSNPTIADTLCWSIYKILCPNNLVLDYTQEEPFFRLWGMFKARQTPFRIGTDDNGRALYGFNVAITTHVD